MTHIPETALVTGGGGFLGGAIVRALLARGDKVVSFSRGAHLWLADLGVAHIRADVANANALAEAATDCSVVYHVAAKAGVWGRYRDYHTANVLGTLAAIDACRRAGVPRLVYCSTPSVIFGDGSDHREPIDESAPYPARYLTAYAATKAQAERVVLAANGRDDGGLATVALRPHLIWGPGDPHIFQRLLDRAKKRKLAMIGVGDNRVSFTYIDNAANAHLQAGDALRDRGGSAAPCAGRAYFVGQDEPVALWSWINGVLKALGVPPVTRRVSLGKARAAGALLEAVYTVLPFLGEPPMTRFVATQLAVSHTYTIARARRDFGYEPAVSTEEGTARLVADLGS